MLSDVDQVLKIAEAEIGQTCKSQGPRPQVFDRSRVIRGTRSSHNDSSELCGSTDHHFNRGGSYYQTNQYGADLLRQGVNHGYEEGFCAGEADRQDRWGSNYQDSYAYQDANYGYSGYYWSVHK